MSLPSELARAARRYAAWLLLLPALAGAVPARAQTAVQAASAPAAATAAPLDPAQARQLLSALQDTAKRQALLDELRTLAAEPAPAAAPATPNRPPGAPATKAGAPAVAKPALVPGSLGEQLVGDAVGWADTLSTEVGATTRAVTGFPAMVRWVRLAAVNPLLRLRVIDAAGKSALILGLSLLAFFGLRRGLRRFMRVLERSSLPGRGAADGTEAEVDETVLNEAHPRVRAARSVRLLRRLPLALLRAALAFLPALAFFAVGELVLGSGLVQLFTTKMIALEAVAAFVWWWGIVCIARLLCTDRLARWRLADPGDEAAAYLDPWVCWLAGAAVLGGLLAHVGGRLGFTEAAQEGVVKLAALIVHVGLVVIVWRSRRRVARHLQPRPGSSPFWTNLAGTFATRWHWVASVWIMIIWLVWAIEPPSGLQHTWRVLGISLLVMIGYRVGSIAALGGLDRAFRATNSSIAGLPGFGQRALRYHQALRQVVAWCIAGLTVLMLLQIWGLDALGWFTAGAVGARVLSALGTVVVIVLLALLAWEMVNSAIERHLHRLSVGGQAAQAGRLRTLAPLLRTCLLSGILVVVVLTVLSEIGVNIAPLLAGAGIFGVALGFGSQKLVQDFITGIFLLLENTMQVGEWVTVSGLSGTVENLSVRTIRLRAGDGSVHVIPFSSVTTVTNTNRGIGNAAVSVVVASGEDTDAVGAALKQIAAEMRADPAYRSGIRADLALWGVDKLDATTVTIVGQIECTDGARWGVQREFNRRVKVRFQELGIRLANPAQAVLLDGPQRGQAGRPRLVSASADDDSGGDTATQTRSPPPAALGNTQ